MAFKKDGFGAAKSGSVLEGLRPKRAKNQALAGLRLLVDKTISFVQSYK
jgi:hypothetical protein